MNIKVAAASLGAALIIAGSPVLASAADTQTGPIRIDNVQTYGGGAADDNVYMILPGWAAIAFTNQYSSPATDVVFALETNGYVIDRFDDVGTFAPGVTINHKFAASQAADNQRVAVEKATFADGTVWVNPGVVPGSERPQEIGVKATARY